jgi:hypothetical protein
VIKTLSYKSEDPGIDSRCGRGFFPGHLTVPCALGSTQPLKMITRLIQGVKAADVKKSGSLNLLEPSGSVQACNGTA